MFDSVRARLTLWYVGIITLLLLTFSAGVYTVLRRNFTERVDGVLRSVSDVTISSLERELSETGVDELAARNTVKALHVPDHTFAIFDANGDLLAERPAGTSALVPPEQLQLKAGDNRVFTIPPPEGLEMRRVVVNRVLLAPMQRNYTVVITRSLTPLLGELATDRGILFVAVPLAALLAGVAGWFLARKSLEPVLLMSAQAHRIGVENLDERIAVSNPRDELGRLAVTFNDLLSRLSGALQSQRGFMADASHQLRTPISVMRTTASVMLSKQHRNEEEYRDAVRVIEAQARRLTRIVEDMLKLARADSGHRSLQQRIFQLDETLLEAIQAAVVLASEKEIRISIHEIADAPFLGDEDLLRQMMLNLLDNAVKYTQVRGEVRVELVQTTDNYCIRVMDNGPGIPTEAQPHIFDRFYRGLQGDTPTHESGIGDEGSGLGLGIARWIAELHGGTLELEWSTAQGSSFLAQLPKKTAMPQSNKQAPQPLHA